MGAGDAYVCAGVESMSRVPMGGWNPLHNPDLVERRPEVYMSMGETAENVAARFGVGARRAGGVRRREPAQGRGRAWPAGGWPTRSSPWPASARTAASGRRPRLRALAALEPAFVRDGTVTAGTSSPLTDGAAAVLVTSERFAREHGLEPLARVRSVAVSGCDPEVMGIGPVQATRKALERAGIGVDELDVVELNEAFASQAVACLRELGIDPARCNIDGGAIALGHPLGATGARITGKAAQLLRREGGRFALATQCIGGGQGIATVLEAVA